MIFSTLTRHMGSLSGGEKVKTQLMRLFIRDVFCAVVGRNLPMTSTLRRLHYWKKYINDWKHIVHLLFHTMKR